MLITPGFVLILGLRSCPGLAVSGYTQNSQAVLSWICRQKRASRQWSSLPSLRAQQQHSGLLMALPNPPCSSIPSLLPAAPSLSGACPQMQRLSSSACA